MTEFTHGIFSASKTIYENNKGSILRTIIYTIGHFAIAITVLMLIAEVSFMVALTDAIVEPLANAIWYFVLDKIWTSKYKKWVYSNPHRPSFLIHPSNFSIFTLHQFSLHLRIRHNLPCLRIAYGLE